VKQNGLSKVVSEATFALWCSLILLTAKEAIRAFVQREVSTCDVGGGPGMQKPACSMGSGGSAIETSHRMLSVSQQVVLKMKVMLSM
jgi:hypothetical protein